MAMFARPSTLSANYKLSTLTLLHQYRCGVATARLVIDTLKTSAKKLNVSRFANSKTANFAVSQWRLFMHINRGLEARLAIKGTVNACAKCLCIDMQEMDELGISQMHSKQTHAD